jgi:thiamine kinase-like enzyme
LIDILRQRITENAGKYFPEKADNTFIVESVPHSFCSDNPLYLFSISQESTNFKKLVIAKHLLPDKSAYDAVMREYDMLKTLYGNNLMVKDNFFVPRPLDHFDDMRVILIEKVDGIRLTDLLRESNRMFSRDATNRLSNIMKRCGKCLKIIHKINLTMKTSSLSREIYNDLFTIINDVHEYLVDKGVHVIKNTGEFHEIIEASINKIKTCEFPLTKQHGDYYAGNLIIKDRDIFVIDFAFSRIGLIYRDISNFLVSVESIKPYPKNFFYDFMKLKSYKKRFLEGYFTNLSEITTIDWILIHLYRLRAILLHCRRRYKEHFSGHVKGHLYFYILSKIYKKRISEEIEKLSNLLKTGTVKENLL